MAVLKVRDGSTWVEIGAAGINFADNQFRVFDNVDDTKLLAFECSGIATGTTRTLTVPNVSSTIATAAADLTDNALLRGDGGGSGLQDSGVLLDDSDWLLFPTNARLQFRDANQYIRSASTNRLSIHVGTQLDLSIGVEAEVSFLTNTIRFQQSGITVGFDWSDNAKLHVEIAAVGQVTFTNGTFEPVTTNDIDLGTSSLEFKAAFFSGEVLANTFQSDVASGTPPLVVASTDKVANFNADLLDGLHVGTSGNVLGALDGANTWSAAQTFATDKKLQFRDTANFINSGAANFLQVNAGATLLLTTGGLTRLTLTSVSGTFPEICAAKTFQANVPGGTAPFACTSTTENNNFNSNFLQGFTKLLINPNTTKGDVASFSTVNARLAVGANDTVLTAASGETTGLKWATVTAASPLTVTTTEVFSGTSPTSMTNLDLSGTIGSNVAIVALSFKSASAMNALSVRTDGDANDYVDTSAEASAYGVQMGHHDDSADLVLIVAASSSGIIEWITETAQTCTVDVLWYIK